MLSVGFAPLVFIQFFGSRAPPITSIQKIGFRLPVKAEYPGQAVPTRFGRHTQPRFHDREHHLPIPIGLEKVFTITLESLFTIVQQFSNTCSRSIGNCFRGRKTDAPSSGGFSTHSFSIRSSRERRLALVIRRSRCQTARYANGSLGAGARTLIFTPGDQVFSNGTVDVGSYYRVSLRDASGCQSHVGIPCTAAPFNQNAPSYTFRDSDPVCEKKARNHDSRYAIFAALLLIYIASDEPNKKVTTRRGCSYGLHCACGPVRQQRRWRGR